MAGFTVVDAIIPAGQNLSNAVDCTAGATNASLSAIICPDDWTTSNHGVTFQASIDGTTFYDCYGPSGQPMAIAVQPGCVVNLLMDFARSVKFIRLRSGSKQQPFNQPVARTFKVILVS